MNVVSVNDIHRNRVSINSTITVRGWVRNRRDSKIGISFLSINDGSCFKTIQIIINNSLPNYDKDIIHLTTGCSVTISGELVISPSKGQDYEILARNVKVIGWVENPNTYPVAKKFHSVEYLREIAHLRPRTNLIGAVTRVRHKLAQALHRFFDDRGFFLVSTPIITLLDTEGAGKMFRVSTLDMENLPLTPDGKIDYKKDFFNKESFLTVSGQLNIEAYACALSKIYTFGPVFRAENSNTSRHLAEFWMLESEVAFADLNDLINLAEDMLKYAFKEVLKYCIDDMNFLVRQVNNNFVEQLEHFVFADFIKINYTEVIDILNRYSKKFKNPVYWGIDLASEHEYYLTNEFFKAPVIIKNYPKKVKAFYMRLNNDDKTVAAMDILMPDIGEIIGGSQREERLNILDARMIELGLNKVDYWWYRDLRRYGTVPHSGFGLGFERLVSFITKTKNIRDVIPFPRTPCNAKF